jgi:hypothetical protein
MDKTAAGNGVPGRLEEEDLGLPALRNERAYINEPGDARASRGQIEAWTRSFRENLQTLRRVRQQGEATEGELLHTMGSYLREFRGRSAWETLGLEDWEAFCAAHLGISVRHGNRLVAFAGAVTQAEARHGVRKCHAGLGLAERLGLSSISELVVAEGAAEPAMWARELGAPVAFLASSASRLERLLSGARHELPEPPSRRVASLVERRKAVIAKVGAKHPAIAELGVKSYVHHGAAIVRHRPVETREEVEALATLYAALAKDG